MKLILILYNKHKYACEKIYSDQLVSQRNIQSVKSSSSLPCDRSIAISKLSFPILGKRLSRKNNNVVVFPFAFQYES
jgi:hypothetical protein